VKVVILAGGLGTRISEETAVRPKPMVEVGGKPILWHIMKIYAAHGLTDFIVCLGYRGYVVKEYFANYYIHTRDVTFDLAAGTTEVLQSAAEPWKVTLIDTGEATMTGGRLRRVLPLLGDEEFCLTYGDGVADVDLGALIDFHRGQGTAATVTAVQPPGRFGAMDLAHDRIRAFSEKPEGDGGWVNGGFFVLSPRVGELLSGDESVWEREPLEALAAQGQLAAYRHQGFWHAMDTLRDRMLLEDLWASGQAPWKLWKP